MRKFKLTALVGLMLVSMSTAACSQSDTNTSKTNHLKVNQPLTPVNVTTTSKKLEAVAPKLKPNVLKLALKAYNKARKQGYDAKEILSVIDFSIPTYKKTLWVFNLNSDKLLFHTYVAHGKGSGIYKATRFSNTPNTYESSLGLYITGKTFYGNDGYSLRLHGLSGHFNDNAYRRDIVMHGAWYVGQAFVNEYDRVGRSWGCTAVSKKLVKPIINKVKDGTLIFAYANDNNWLQHGPYVA